MTIEILRDVQGRPTHLRIRVGDGAGVRGLLADAWNWLPRAMERAATAFAPAAAAATAGGTATVVIEAQPDTIGARLRALWQYRSFYTLLVKELTLGRARGSLLGAWWIFLRPLIPAISLIFAFANVRPVETGGLPYPVFFLSGYLPFLLFQSALRYVPRSLRAAQGLMKRTYFPRMLVPMAALGLPYLEFAVMSGAFIVSVLIATFRPGGHFPLYLGWNTLWLVPCFVAAQLLALSIGMIFSVIALFFRDVIFSLRFFSQIFLLLTPVIYPVTFIPEQYRWVLYVINPMAQIVMVSRLALTGQGQLQLGFLLLSFLMVLGITAASVVFFLRAEVHLGDQL